jgi:hypothetical protein
LPHERVELGGTGNGEDCPSLHLYGDDPATGPTGQYQCFLASLLGGVLDREIDGGNKVIARNRRGRLRRSPRNRDSTRSLLEGHNPWDPPELILELVLDAFQSDSVDVDETDDVACNRSSWVDPLGLVVGVDPGKAERHHLFGQIQFDLALQIDETRPRLKFREKIDGVTSEQPSNLLGNEHRLFELLRVGIDADGLDGHGQRVAVPIEDVAALRNELALGLALFGPLLGQARSLNHLHLVETHSHAQPGKSEPYSKKAQPEVGRG